MTAREGVFFCRNMFIKILFTPTSVPVVPLWSRVPQLLRATARHVKIRKSIWELRTKDAHFLEVSPPLFLAGRRVHRSCQTWQKFGGGYGMEVSLVVSCAPVQWDRNARADCLSCGADFLRALSWLILGGGDWHSNFGRSALDDSLSDWCGSMFQVWQAVVFTWIQIFTSSSEIHGTPIDTRGTNKLVSSAMWEGFAEMIQRFPFE